MRLLLQFTLMILFAAITVQVSYSQTLSFTTSYRLYDRSLEKLTSHIVIADGILKIDGVRQGLTGHLKSSTRRNSKNRIYFLDRKSNDESTPKSIVTDTVTLVFNKKGKPVSMAYSFAQVPMSNYSSRHVYMTTEASNFFIKHYLVGKKFYQKSESCLKTVDGGYMEYGHTLIEFLPYTVLVKSWQDREPDYRKSKVQKPKRYTYYIQDTTIKVKGLSGYLPLAIELPHMAVYTSGYDITNRNEWRFFEIVQ
ncbi:hypothetical protein [Mucilaginibacter sp. CSA2-8R]|uniref:hypothetical protein n=1 Tax=Mucilaginibacter sp. CSA2-8R TaxID=3141542 RepID=UPI00315C920A